MNDQPDSNQAGWQDPPEPLRGQELGTFTHHSIAERLPEVGRRTLAENDFPAAIATQIDDLINEIPNANLAAFEDPAAPDIDDWNRYLQPHLDHNWLEAPWFFIETYFYRRLVALTGYFEVGNESWRDPFHYQKQTALKGHLSSFQPPTADTPIEEILLSALWGNQADLSLWPADSESTDGGSPSPAADRVLVDDRRQVSQLLRTNQDNLRRLDLVLDNAGEELLADLALAANLANRFEAATIHLHAKAHPTFVSDATPVDVLEALNQLQLEGNQAAQQMAQSLLGGLGAGSFVLDSHLHWTSPLAGWSMPVELAQQLARSDLIIVKGDANYRRLLGDRHWSFDRPLAEILGYLPAPTLLLRTLKSEVAAGLPPKQQQRADQEDDRWMINGNWGLIQFVGSADNS